MYSSAIQKYWEGNAYKQESIIYNKTNLLNRTQKNPVKEKCEDHDGHKFLKLTKIIHPILLWSLPHALLYILL
jgi:hypothetical protein